MIRLREIKQKMMSIGDKIAGNIEIFDDKMIEAEAINNAGNVEVDGDKMFENVCR